MWDEVVDITMDDVDIVEHGGSYERCHWGADINACHCEALITIVQFLRLYCS